MKKILFTAVLTLIGIYTATAQVGIGTETPKTSLQVVGEPAITTTADGVQVPSLSLAQLDAKITAYSNDQDGAIVFIDDVTNTSTTAQTGGINAVGFYYYDADNDTWKTVGATTATAYNGTLPVENGGTGSSTQNFVDLATAQTVSGAKTFSDNVTINSNLVTSGVVALGDLSGFSGTFANRATLDVISDSNGDLMTGYVNGFSGDRFNIKLNNSSSVAEIKSGGGYDIKLFSESGNMFFEGQSMMSTPDFSFNGTVTANAFVGDGSGLTGVKDASFDLTDAADGDLLRYDATASKWVKVTPNYISNGDMNVGFGTETPDASAQLELQSTTKGFLPQRMTTNNRNDIENPVEGLTIYNTDDVCLNIYVGFGWRNLCAEAGPNDVINPKTGQIWMDRNLGASQVATSSTDADAYGDLYQWGRGADGHQTIVWKSSTESDGAEQTNETTTTSSSTAPGTAFITGSANWYTGSNPDDLWKEDGTGVNDPCPSGYRVPTAAEWEAELGTGKIIDVQSAFEILKLPLAGYRDSNSGLIHNISTTGFYWSSTVSSSDSRRLNLYSTPYMTINERTFGFSVRCIKE